MKAIAVFGRKGGSGKTLVSHMLSHGMTMLGYTVVMLQTDVRTNRPPDLVEGREYFLATTRGDDNDSNFLLKTFDRTSALSNSILVIDGGANRRNIDLVLTPLTDLILVPTGYSHEDVQVAEADFWELSNKLRESKSEAEAYILMNRWPGVARKLQQVQQKPWVRDFIVRTERQKSLFPFFIPDMPSLLDMANSEAPRTTPLIDGKARAFATFVARKLGLIEGTVDNLPSAFEMAASQAVDDDEGEGGGGSGRRMPELALAKAS